MKLTRIYKNGSITQLLETSKGWLSLPRCLLADLPELCQKALSNLDQYDETNFILNLDDYQYAPLLQDLKNIICIGLNYQDHVAETGLVKTDFPEIFTKTSSALNQHQAPIKVINQAYKYDYEGELVIVIGKDGKNISLEQANDYILGYTIGNDFSARDLQFCGSQWILGKTLDGFAPIGPVIVTPDKFNLEQAHIRTSVNGELRQEASLKQMIFKPAEIIAYLSQFITLQAGDIIFTGTPSGVILGENEKKWPWLKSGDRISISISGIGQLDNTLVDEN